MAYQDEIYTNKNPHKSIPTVLFGYETNGMYKYMGYIIAHTFSVGMWFAVNVLNWKFVVN